VNAFIMPERRDRWLSLLGNRRNRWKILYRLADNRDFNSANLIPVSKGAPDPVAIAEQLRQLGASDEAYVISEIIEVDTKFLPLVDALSQVVGMGLGSIVSCIPGKLAYHEAEVRSRHVLCAASIN